MRGAVLRTRPLTLTFARRRLPSQIDGTTYFIPSDGGLKEGFSAWDTSSNIMTLSDGSGDPDCIYLRLVTDNHIRIVILDSAAVRASARARGAWGGGGRDALMLFRAARGQRARLRPCAYLYLYLCVSVPAAHPPRAADGPVQPRLVRRVL